MILYVVDPEAVDTRYTAQWKKHLSLQLSNNTDEEIVVISGGETSRQQRPGLFPTLAERTYIRVSNLNR